MKEQREHAYTRITKDIKGRQLSGAVLLYGVEQLMVSWARDEIIKAYTAEATRTMDLTVIDRENFSADVAIESLETLPMFSEKKVVVLDDFAPVFGKEAQKIGADLEALASYIEKIPEYSLLIITAPAVPQNSRRKKTVLEKALEKSGTLYDFEPLPDRELKKFINKRIHAAGKTIGSRAMNALIENSGYHNKNIEYALYNLDNDVRKIISYSKETEISESDVAAGISDNLEYNVFRMMDTVCANRKEDAFSLLHDMLLQGASEYSILAAIAGQLELMLEVKQLQARGMSKRDMASRLKTVEFRVGKAMDFARKYSEPALKRILSDAFEVDDYIKSGILPPPLALELLIARI